MISLPAPAMNPCKATGWTSARRIRVPDARFESSSPLSGGHVVRGDADPSTLNVKIQSLAVAVDAKEDLVLRGNLLDGIRQRVEIGVGLAVVLQNDVAPPKSETLSLRIRDNLLNEHPRDRRPQVPVVEV